MAQLARKCPDTVSRDLQIVVAYFNHLIQAPTELHDSIREALISIAPAFRWQLKPTESGHSGDQFVPNANLKLLLALLTEHTESKLTIVQNVVCVFLTTCFPDHYVPARYLLLLIAGERYAYVQRSLSARLFDSRFPFSVRRCARRSRSICTECRRRTISTTRSSRRPTRRATRRGRMSQSTICRRSSGAWCCPVSCR